MVLREDRVSILTESLTVWLVWLAWVLYDSGELPLYFKFEFESSLTWLNKDRLWIKLPKSTQTLWVLVTCLELPSTTPLEVPVPCDDRPSIEDFQSFVEIKFRDVMESPGLKTPINNQRLFITQAEVVTIVNLYLQWSSWVSPPRHLMELQKSPFYIKYDPLLPKILEQSSPKRWERGNPNETSERAMNMKALTDTAVGDQSSKA